MKQLKLVFGLVLFGLILSGALGGFSPRDLAASRLGAQPAATLVPAAFLPILMRPDPNAPPADSASGLDFINFYRDRVGLPPATENPAWSTGCQAHARYMVANDAPDGPENPQNPLFTPAGETARQNGNLLVTNHIDLGRGFVFATWLQGPFHALRLLNPQLTQVGYGEYREAGGAWNMGACLDVGQGVEQGVQTRYPVMWPPRNGQTRVLAFTGIDAHNPLASCGDSYQAPAGPPILLQLGADSRTPVVTDHDFRSAQGSLAHCVFDERTYTNPNPDSQQIGRALLDAQDGVVLMPRQPLVAGSTYTVSLTVDGQVIEWTFQTVNPNRRQPSQTEVEISRFEPMVHP